LLERVNDFAHEGRQVLASRLGYRITSTFVDRFLGRIFESPGSVFTDEMLRPEKQDLGAFAEGVDAICEAQQRVAAHYFEDGSVADACPPMRALLHIMRDGHFEGKDVHDPEIRGMFSREALVASDWYGARLKAKQRRDVAFWTAQRDAAQMARVSAEGYLEELVGTIGADPSAVG
jgi:phosphoenolpyruvate carboxykinase (diphosphate)